MWSNIYKVWEWEGLLPRNDKTHWGNYHINASGGHEEEKQKRKKKRRDKGEEESGTKEGQGELRSSRKIQDKKGRKKFPSMQDCCRLTTISYVFIII